MCDGNARVIALIIDDLTDCRVIGSQNLNKQQQSPYLTVLQIMWIISLIFPISGVVFTCLCIPDELLFKSPD